MSKYPLDAQALSEMTRDIVQHNTAQELLIGKLSGLLSEAIADADEDADWIKEATEMSKSLSKRKLDFETHRFNQKNGYGVGQRSPYQATPEELQEAEDLGPEMSEAEIAALFNAQPAPKPKKKKQKKLSKMSLEEIEAWEKAQDNSNDIYKVSARIKNLARMSVKANLTTQGDMVCNTFTHMIKNLYDFAETIQDKETKIRLMELVKKQEEMPANLISALFAGVSAPNARKG